MVGQLNVDFGNLSITKDGREIATFDVESDYDKKVAYLFDFRLSSEDEDNEGNLIVEERKGHGREAYNALETNLRSQGIKKIYLEDVLEDAAGFWETMGFHAPDDYAEKGDATEWYKRLRPLPISKALAESRTNSP